MKNTNSRKRKVEQPPTTDKTDSLVLVDDEPASGPSGANGDSVGNRTTHATPKRIPDDEKVVNALKKLTVTRQPETTAANVSLTLIVSIIEAAFFSPLASTIASTFSLTDVTLSPPVDGAIDRFVVLDGKIDAVCRAAIFVAFNLHAKLNNFIPNELITLKSANYSLTLLEAAKVTQDAAKKYKDIYTKTAIKVFDYSDSYGRSSAYATVYLRGDFQSIFQCLAGVIQDRAPRTDPAASHKIQQLSVVGNYGNPEFFHRQAVNNDVLDTSADQILQYIRK